MQHRDKVKKLLQKHLPDYDKHVQFADDFAEGYDEAVKRSKQLAKIAKDLKQGFHECNPSTRVYVLTESIKEV